MAWEVVGSKVTVGEHVPVTDDTLPCAGGLNDQLYPLHGIAEGKLGKEANPDKVTGRAETVAPCVGEVILTVSGSAHRAVGWIWKAWLATCVLNSFRFGPAMMGSHLKSIWEAL